jgi:hypothetical protein
MCSLGALVRAEVEDALLQPAAAQRAGGRAREGADGIGTEQCSGGGVHPQRLAVRPLHDDAHAHGVEQVVEQGRQGGVAGDPGRGLTLGPVAEPARADMTRSPDEHAGLP